MTKAALFPTSVVGSLPRPSFVRDIVTQPASEVTEDDRKRLDDAVRSAVELQEQAGLDIVTDGEWRRRSYIGVIADLAHGFELSTHPEDGRPWTIAVERLEEKDPGFVAREIRFLRSISSRQIKATLPAPALLGERMWDPDRSRKAYPRRIDFIRDCARVLRREVELIRDAGADVVQIDDPHLCLFVDPDVRASYEDADAAAAFAVDAVNEVVTGVDDMKLAVHLCRRAGARVRGEGKYRGNYAPIVNQLNALRVHHLTVEFTDAGPGDEAVLRELREEL